MLKRFHPWLFLSLFMMPAMTLQADEALAALREKIGGIGSSFSGNFTITSPSGGIKTGKIYYQAPNRVHLKLSSGAVLASNGRFIWIFSPATMICAKQDAGGSSGGIFGLLAGYTGQIRGSNYVFRSKTAYYDEITVKAGGGMIQSVKLKRENEITTISFSGINVGAGIQASLFNFKPPTSARVIENPLN